MVHIIQKPDLFLSSLQIGLTLTELLLGWFGGVSVSDYVVHFFESIPALQDYSVILGNCVSLAIITYCAILLEIVPKRITMIYPEEMLLCTSYVMRFYIIVIYPFVWILTASIKLCLKALKIRDIDEKTSVEEILFVINQAHHSGVLHKIESGMMKRMVTLSDMQVGAIMTPRNKIVMLDLDKRVDYNVKLLHDHNFTYFPAVKGNLDNFIGIVPTKEVYRNANLDNAVLQKIALKTPVLYIPEVSKLTKLIELLDIHQTKFAMVVDEYGDIEGVVTFTDVIQSFLGDTAKISERGRRNISRCKDGTYVIDGNVLVDEVKDVLNIDALPGEDEEEYRTLASFLIKYLDNIPKVGDYVKHNNWIFVVDKMDKNRIEKVHVSDVSECKT